MPFAGISSHLYSDADFAHFNVGEVTDFAFGFAEAPITFRIEFDASLFGLGIIFFLVTSTGEVPIGAVVADLSPLEFGSEAKYQNTAEFLCVVMAFLVMARRGIAPCRVGLRGDSRSVSLALGGIAELQV